MKCRTHPPYRPPRHCFVTSGRSPDSRADQIAISRSDQEPAPSRVIQHSGGVPVPILIYRCGGSVGFVTVLTERTNFPFNPYER